MRGGPAVWWRGRTFPGRVVLPQTRQNIPMPAKNLPIYQLKITLLGVQPLIWRRIEMPASLRLCCLHSAIQVVMGWTDSHLHQFEKGGKNWGVPAWDEFKELDLIDEKKPQVAEVLRREGEALKYQYDFGDDWEHEVVLERVMPANGRPSHPICLVGERRCPPEDVGGVSGYQEFLEAIFDPTHEEYEHYRKWAGGHFLDEFDLNAVNQKLSRMRWPVRHRW
jgi:pRiA4b ORF-3-like protein